MSMNKIVVTGSNGLVGSQVVERFCALGWQTFGIDNNMRRDFFGPEGDTRWNQSRLQQAYQNFVHEEADIRNRDAVKNIIHRVKPDAVVHAAAQPSHDLAAKRPFDDFDTNAAGTLNLLEACRKVSTDITFIYLSTNKVYGDGPNKLPLKEEKTRWSFAQDQFANGISESFSIDQCKHSLFGASKLAADIMVQEYGQYFGMKTCCLRGGCLTGPNHSGVRQHGFLSYLIRCNVEGNTYHINGYQGKQVRDNLHSHDVCSFIEHYIANPRCGEVYNLGGGKRNSISILEAFSRIEDLSGKKMQFEYHDAHRVGDHICYYSDLSKINNHYPTWKISRGLEEIFKDIYSSATKRQII